MQNGFRVQGFRVLGFRGLGFSGFRVLVVLGLVKHCPQPEPLKISLLGYIQVFGVFIFHIFLVQEGLLGGSGGLSKYTYNPYKPYKNPNYPHC